MHTVHKARLRGSEQRTGPPVVKLLSAFSRAELGNDLLKEEWKGWFIKRITKCC